MTSDNTEKHFLAIKVIVFRVVVRQKKSHEKKVCEGMSSWAKVNLQPINPDKSLVNLIVNVKKCPLSWIARSRSQGSLPRLTPKAHT